MKTGAFVTMLFLTAALLATRPEMARAQEPRVEVGASLASLVVGLGDNDGSLFGIPSGGFGLVNPGVYVSLFLGSHVAIEPQIGLLRASSGGDSATTVNLVGQLNYFISGATEPSAYLFVAAGLTESSDPGTTPNTVGGGAGYRIPVGEAPPVFLDTE